LELQEIEIVSAFLRKLLTKISIHFSSVKFRMRFGIYTGTVRADSASISKSVVGKHVSIRGAIASRNSGLHLGDACSVDSSVEVGAEKGGKIVIGSYVSIGPRSIISTSGGVVEIGSRTSFFSDCLVSGVVSIGKNCLFAKNVTILSSTHQLHGPGTIRENDAAAQTDPSRKLYSPVVIGDDCWLGSNSVIMPGVKLETGTVVGANAVVTKSFPAYSIVGGVPAKLISSRMREKESTAV
jgi:acetyltransferase-like isoleucine patch superfamily enzyme